MKHISVAVLIVASASCIAAARPRRDIVIERTIVAPDSYEEMFEASEVIVRASIVTSEAKTVARSGDLPGLLTEYTARVIETTKGTLKAGEVFRFVQQAGHLETADLSITVLGAQPLVRGAEYVLFLKPYPFFRTLIIAHDPEGAFLISNGTVHPVGQSAVARQHRGSSSDAFIRELKNMARKTGVRQ
jgi:hypothetical protein